ncbi:hypothetical protein SAMN05421759_11338 [Roseivivax lentus]|uniref:Uncharacterized protein n=1 Tax=Roseivivax lentus TaxID=633194 RepID=A0A1N7P6W3_9RHOB|nr:hypothetical protein [Roseivivax lentus]SIT06342.1 hypothetical protein SAMN05421759_11338 [Roseivivax lentus]
MLAIKAGLGMAALPASRHAPPAGLGGGSVLSALTPVLSRGRVTTGIDPRSLVDPAIWTGPVYHVDGSAGDDANSGLGAVAGDFSNALRTIYRAFELGNATNAAYRIAVQPGS